MLTFQKLEQAVEAGQALKAAGAVIRISRIRGVWKLRIK
jgi:hypothetical protein